MKILLDRRVRAGCGFLLVGASLGGLGCAEEGRFGVESAAPGPAAGAPDTESAEARALIATLRSRFGATRVLDALPAGLRRRAKVTLSAQAGGGFALTAISSGAKARVTLVGATDAPSEAASGFVVYRGGHRSGADIIHRITSDGAEDYLSFERAPGAEEIAYTVEIGDGLAGARLFAGALELLDAAGTPRLRMSPPYVIDAAGARHEARVSLSDCAFDADPRPPWGRAVTPPGASSCTVHLGWGGDGVVYPALVDPLWGTGGDLVIPRFGHAAAVLEGGRVLLVGGHGTPANGTWGHLATPEIYDPSTSTWSVTGDTMVARDRPTATTLAGGEVLVTGGIGGLPDLHPTSSAELYDPLTGTWSPAATMAVTHYSHTATLLGDGKVLVVGGAPYNSPVISEIYDPVLAAWSPTAAQGHAHQFHTASLLANGKVLVVGSTASGTTSMPEVYDPIAGTWTVTGPGGTNSGVRHHTASLLANGNVLVAGGANNLYGYDTAYLYNPVTNGWSATGSLNQAFAEHTSSVLVGGKVLVVGYPTGAPLGGGTEIYDPALGTWTNLASLTIPRWGHTTSALPSGQLLVAGGTIGPDDTYPALAELFPFAEGSACTSPDECLSGQCAAGVCCVGDCGGSTGSSTGAGGGGETSSSAGTSSSGVGAGGAGGGGGMSSSVSVSCSAGVGSGGAGGSEPPEAVSGGCGGRAAGSSEGEASCSCEAAGARSSGAGMGLGVAAMLAMVWRRRRRP